MRARQKGGLLTGEGNGIWYWCSKDRRRIDELIRAIKRIYFLKKPRPNQHRIRLPSLLLTQEDALLPPLLPRAAIGADPVPADRALQFFSLPATIRERRSPSLVLSPAYAASS